MSKVGRPARPARRISKTLGKSPHLGLVCLTWGDECRYRSLTRARYLALANEEKERALTEVYWDNLARVHRALTFCQQHRIRLYRVISSLFPMSDEAVGERVLRSMAANLSSVGRRAQTLGIRVIQHPDQFVVLNSESENVVRTSVKILEKHGLAFDLMGLPRSPWAAMNIHGGKAGRSAELVRTIRQLPPEVRSRLTLENDERAYGAAEILDVCRDAGVPMVFDAHHHVVHDGLDSYEHPSVAKFTRAAAATWPDPSWQVVHLSNGHDAFADPRHSEQIVEFPSSFLHAPWIEIEARGKDCAIERLRKTFPGLA